MQGLRKDDDAATFKSEIAAEIKQDVSVLIANAVNQLSKNFMSLMGDAGGKFGGGDKDDDLKSLKNGFFVTAGGLGSHDGLLVSLNNKVEKKKVCLNNKVPLASENQSDDEGEDEDEYQSRRSSSTRVSAALKDREVVGGKKTTKVGKKEKDNKDSLLSKKEKKEDKAAREADGLTKDAFPTLYPYISSYAELKQGMAKSAIV